MQLKIQASVVISGTVRLRCDWIMLLFKSQWHFEIKAE